MYQGLLNLLSCMRLLSSSLNVPTQKENESTDAKNGQHHAFAHLLRIQHVSGDAAGDDAQTQQLQESAQGMAHPQFLFLKTRSSTKWLLEIGTSPLTAWRSPAHHTSAKPQAAGWHRSCTPENLAFLPDANGGIP
jgi:hypothetical protein